MLSAKRSPLVLQALIDAEATEVIGAGRYQRSASRTTHRNGSRARLLSTKAGAVELKIPKLGGRGVLPGVAGAAPPYRPGLVGGGDAGLCMGPRPTGRRPGHGVGVDRGISKSEGSRICAELDGEVAALRSRSLAHIAFP
jgi:putative transposase